MSKITNTQLHLVEAASAGSSTAAEGQIWVKSDAPSSLYYTDDAGTDFRMGGITVTSELAASGTTMTIGSIPPGVKKVDILFAGLSTSAGAEWLVRIGDSDGIETSGYFSCSGDGDSADTSSVGYIITYGVGAPELRDGIVSLYLEDVSNNTWISNGILNQGNAANLLNYSAGRKSLSGVLTQVQVLNESTDTFDAGAIALQYS